MIKNLRYLFVAMIVCAIILGGCQSSTRVIGTSGLEATKPIDVTLTVELVGGLLAVRPRFENISDKVIMVKEGQAGFGLRSQKISTPVSLGMDEYVIKSGGSRLRYIGIDPYFVHGPTPEQFSAVLPHEVIATRFNRLDDSYEFLPGTHEYTIAHIHMERDNSTGIISEHASRIATFTYTKPVGRHHADGSTSD